MTNNIADILARELPLGIPDPLPPKRNPVRTLNNPKIPHAPKRTPNLNAAERQLAIKNALRYFPSNFHEELIPEFLSELDEFGHIYMYRLRPTEYEIKAHPISVYPAKHQHAATLMLMIMNNLDIEVAMFPEELITYGGNGGVFNNWAQYRLVMKYLTQLTDRQTLVLYSGHPAGLFPSNPEAPRAVITNGMMIPLYSTIEMYDKCYALGVTQYGQMTAGSFCYIGSQGIVHGTTITIRSAGAKYLGTEDLRGKVFLTAGTGGMSGARPKAGTVCNAITVVAECDPDAIYKRHRQGWLMEVHTNVDDIIKRVKEAKSKKEAVSIGYLGNVVTLWERFAEEEEHLIDLGSDQTSCHNPFGGGYWPVQVSFEEGKKLLETNPQKFKELVQETLRRHITAINKVKSQRGMSAFWDYGNSFLVECARAGGEVCKPGETFKDGETLIFRYPSYVQDIMGDVFSLGFGPFRWICTSGDPKDLATSDKIAEDVLQKMLDKGDLPAASAEQVKHNLVWIRHALQNNLVIGSQARILYADAQGRREIAHQFNLAIKDGRISAPIALSRDHHDVSGTDSPFRETADIKDGSAFCADMSIHNVIGDSFRGATWTSIHNGGGCGWGLVSNGGFGLVLDGSEDAERKSQLMLGWDVNNGVARRAWAGNGNGNVAIRRAMEQDPNLVVTLANTVDENVAKKFFS